MNELVTLCAYFLIYSFIGWLLESTYKSVLQKKIINSGFLHGPICPIYGYGAMIMYLSLKDVTDNIFVLFLFGLIVLSVFEYIVGLFLEIAFKTKYWDYSDKKFNIQGRVCLLNSMYWGILGIVFMKGIHPFVEKCVDWVPTRYLQIAVGTGLAVMIIDTVITTIGLIKINTKLKNWEQITDKIKSKMSAIEINAPHKLDKLKNLKIYHGYQHIKKIPELKSRDELLGELKVKQQQIQEKLERRLARLKRAFPTMSSEAISKFLSNKEEKKS